MNRLLLLAGNLKSLLYYWIDEMFRTDLCIILELFSVVCDGKA